jgi:hypothetical protein
LLSMTGAESAAIAVSIEVPQGPIVETLLERGFHTRAVIPKQLGRFRDRFTVAGAKDNWRDAHVLADSLRTNIACGAWHRGCTSYRIARVVVCDQGSAAGAQSGRQPGDRRLDEVKPVVDRVEVAARGVGLS